MSITSVLVGQCRSFRPGMAYVVRGGLYLQPTGRTIGTSLIARQVPCPSTARAAPRRCCCYEPHAMPPPAAHEQRLCCCEPLRAGANTACPHRSRGPGFALSPESRFEPMDAAGSAAEPTAGAFPTGALPLQQHAEPI